MNDASYDLVALKVELAEIIRTLRELDAFESLWADFSSRLRELVQLFNGNRWAPEGSVHFATVTYAEKIRNELNSRQALVLPRYKDPLAAFCRTSLRTPADQLYGLIGEAGYKDHPTADALTSVVLISSNRFEAQMGDCQSLIDERRRELLNRKQTLEVTIEEVEKREIARRKHELEVAADGGVQRAIVQWWDKKKTTTLWGRAAWWLFEDKLKTRILTAVLLVGSLYLIPVTRNLGAVMWRFMTVHPAPSDSLRSPTEP